MEENRERAGWQEVHCLEGRLYLRIPEEYGRPSDEWIPGHSQAAGGIQKQGWGQDHYL